MSLKRGAPLSGIAFVVLFVGGVLAGNVPSDSASNATWVAAYTGHGNQVGHLLSGVMLILAGLALVVFLTHLWNVAAARRPGAQSPLPLVAAGLGGACIAVGGILMGAISGAALTGSAPLPSAELLRFANDAGFGMVGVAGMLATSLSIACLSLQARAARLFGTRMLRFSLGVAVVLLAAIEFIPILGLLAWAIVVAVWLLRGGAEQAPRSAAPRFAAHPTRGEDTAVSAR